VRFVVDRMALGKFLLCIVRSSTLPIVPVLHIHVHLPSILSSPDTDSMIK